MTHLEKHVDDFVAAQLPNGMENETIQVGFSGGADSAALLLALHNLKLTTPIQAVHFNHNLRGNESQKDEEWCRLFCATRKIPFIARSLDVKTRMRETNEGLEQAAREMRLNAWREITDGKGCVALAHHADDAVENLFLRLGRGSNASGLGGLRKLTRINNVTFIRPLLQLHRTDIENYLHLCGVNDWREDSSNRDTSLARNALRHQLLPLLQKKLGERFVKGCLASLEALQKDADYLENIANEIAQNRVDRKQLDELPDALLPRVIRALAQKETGTDLILSRATCHRLKRELNKTSDKPRRIPLNKHMSIIIDREQTRFANSATPNVPATIWKWREQRSINIPELECQLQAETLKKIDHEKLTNTSSDCAYFQLDQVPNQLIVRGWNHGDVITAFNRKTKRKLKDFMSTAKIPIEKRPLQTVVCANNEIIWAPKLRHADFAKVEDPNKPILKLTVLVKQGLRKT